jgi:hypothetical protein
VEEKTMGFAAAQPILRLRRYSAALEGRRRDLVGEE